MNRITNFHAWELKGGDSFKQIRAVMLGNIGRSAAATDADAAAVLV